METSSRHCSSIIMLAVCTVLQSVFLYFEKLSWHLQSPVLCKKLLLSLKSSLGWFVPVGPEAGPRWLNEQCSVISRSLCSSAAWEWAGTGAEGWKSHPACPSQPCGSHLEITVSLVTVRPGQTCFTTGTRERVQLFFQRLVGELNLHLFYERCSVYCRWV